MCRSNCRRVPPTRTSPPHGCSSEISEGNEILLLRAKQPCREKQERQNAISLTLEWAVLGKKTWEKWLLEWHREGDRHKGKAELLAHTINLTAGRSVSPEILSHPSYKRLPGLINKAYHKRLFLPKTRVQCDCRDTLLVSFALDMPITGRGRGRSRGVRGGRGRGRSQRNDEVQDIVPIPALAAQDDAFSSSDDSTEPPDCIPSTEPNDIPIVDSQSANLDVPLSQKRGRGAAKSTEFEKLRKHGKIPLRIKDGETAPCCENATIFTTRVTWLVKHHMDLSHASWHAVPANEKEELVTRVQSLG
ncbi:hypothetical protein I3842_01G095400 [Carya illinoinensis]|uniref:Uncharacterized protein n=1 Tax=Carya illinoinensis TaxID=32201 RepID=A0A922K2X6_CARIL|nr:hypothetical protein I3842_01G095400 [Carya illinoinensis]